MKKREVKKRKAIALVVSEFNRDVTDGLLSGALGVLKEKGFPEKGIKVFRCPGAFEIPFIARKLSLSKKYGAVICLGAVIKGETAHFEYISKAVTDGILLINLESDIPVIFGVLTCYTEEQAIKRSSPGPDNKGAEAARAALEMIRLKIKG